MTDPKDFLRQMIDHTVDNNPDAASDAFKNYLVPKTMEVLGITSNAPTAKTEAEPEAEPKAEPEAEPKAAPAEEDQA